MDSEWLNLSDAAEILGVHPSTVRAWADRGDLPTQRTSGGHRRFRRVDVETRAATEGNSREAGAQLIIQTMLGRARFELTDGVLNNETWYQQLDAGARTTSREIGRQLLHLVAHFLTHPHDQTTLSQARELGHAYFLLGKDNGLSLVETTQAYLFFSEFLSQTIYDMTLAAGSQSPTDWRQLRNQAVAFTNEILLALIKAYELNECKNP